MEFREQFELGIEEFNGSHYFECHDTFEELWTDERGERRLFLQGLIQAAVGIFHATRSNAAGAESQLTKSLAKLIEVPDHYLGVDVLALRQDLEQFRQLHRERVSQGQPGFDPAAAPRIVYRRESGT